MADENPLDEQKEAEILAFLRANHGFKVRSPIFLARKDFFNALQELGMPRDRAAIVVGRMEFLVGEKNFGGIIYETLLEISAKNIFDLWEGYKTEIDEGIFLESCRQYKFCPPIVGKKDEGDEEKKSE